MTTPVYICTGFLEHHRPHLQLQRRPVYGSAAGVLPWRTAAQAFPTCAHSRVFRILDSSVRQKEPSGKAAFPIGGG